MDRRILGLVVIVWITTGCGDDAPVQPSAALSFNGLPIPATMQATSASRPVPGAADAFAKCHLGGPIPFDRVAGFGYVASTRDVPLFVPLSGREPLLREPGGAWVAQIRGDLHESGHEIWTDPTCIVTESDSGYFATGPVLDTTTNIVRSPEPGSTAPSRGLPPLLP